MQRYERRGFLTQRFSRPVGWLLAAVLVVAPSLIEVLLPVPNLSVFYILALVVFAQAAPRRGHILLAGAFLILLAYGCFGVKYSLYHTVDSYWTFRLVNRTFAAGSIAIAALLLHSWVHFRAYWEARQEHLTPTDMDAFIFTQIFQSIEHLVAILISLVLIVAISATDYLTPCEFNLAILYAVPVVIAGLTEHRGVLWTSVLLTIALSFIGLYIGRPSDLPDNMWRSILENRAITAAMLAGVGLFMDLALFRRGLSDRLQDSMMTREWF